MYNDSNRIFIREPKSLLDKILTLNLDGVSSKLRRRLNNNRRKSKLRVTNENPSLDLHLQ